MGYYLCNITYDFMTDQYTGTFEDGTEVTVSESDIPQGMSVYDFIKEVEDGAEWTND